MVSVQANGGTKVVRIAGTGDVITGAGALLAAGARHVQGARDILQGRQAGVFRLTLPPICHISAVVNSYSLTDQIFTYAQRSHWMRMLSHRSVGKAYVIELTSRALHEGYSLHKHLGVPWGGEV